MAMQLPVQAGGAKVTLGAPEDAVQTDEAAPVPGAVFLEAKADAGGGYFEVRVIRAGASGNGNFYPDAVLREAAPLFNGVKVFVKSDKEHLAGEGKDVRNLLGLLRNSKFAEGTASDAGEVRAEFVPIQPAAAVPVMLREACQRGLQGAFGLSVDLAGLSRQTGRGRELVKALKVSSVDLIVEPGAGGAVVNFVEAQEEPMLRTEMLRFVEAQRPELLAGADKTVLTDEQVMGMYRAALTPKVDPDDAVTRVVEAAMRRVTALTEIDASDLPEPAKERLRQRFQGVDFREADADVASAIKAERAYLGQVSSSGTVQGLGGRVKAGETRHEKVVRMLEACFDPAHKDHRHAYSFKECYIDITGDRHVTGQLSACDMPRFTEAMGVLSTADFPLLLGDALNKRLLTLYRNPEAEDLWRQVAYVSPVADFDTQHAVRWGGFGDLPEVGENAPYPDLDIPAEEEATYKVRKRGGKVAITLEMIKGDRIRVIQQIPAMLASAAKRTLSKAVFGVFTANPVIYDGLTLFHAMHANLGTDALSAAAYYNGVVAIKRQPELGTGDAVGIRPDRLLVPDCQEGPAYDLFVKGTNNDETYTQSLKPKIVPVWCWSDQNDWVQACDPAKMPGIEVGFLDNRQEPELFVQDLPNVGSVFNNDAITYKPRHIWGVCVTDFRPFRRNVVAG